MFRSFELLGQKIVGWDKKTSKEEFFRGRCMSRLSIMTLILSEK
jgi:hypothetical protein